MFLFSPMPDSILIKVPMASNGRQNNDIAKLQLLILYTCKRKLEYLVHRAVALWFIIIYLKIQLAFKPKLF